MDCEGSSMPRAARPSEPRSDLGEHQTRKRRVKLIRYPGSTVLFVSLGRLGFQVSYRTKRDLRQRG